MFHVKYFLPAGPENTQTESNGNENSIPVPVSSFSGRRPGRPSFEASLPSIINAPSLRVDDSKSADSIYENQQASSSSAVHTEPGCQDDDEMDSHGPCFSGGNDHIEDQSGDDLDENGSADAPLPYLTENVICINHYWSDEEFYNGKFINAFYFFAGDLFYYEYFDYDSQQDPLTNLTHCAFHSKTSVLDVFSERK